MKEWRKYEAAKLLEEREARGEFPLNQDFAPAEIIESMVPPAGDWEEEWLRNQPSIRTKSKKHYSIETVQWWFFLSIDPFTMFVTKLYIQACVTFFNNDESGLNRDWEKQAEQP